MTPKDSPDSRTARSADPTPRPDPAPGAATVFDLDADYRHLWALDPEVDYLNHGSFGACPRAVLDQQQELRAEMEWEPIDFLHRRLEIRLDEARGSLGEFIGADPDDLAFVPNATAGVNSILRSLDFGPGDELLVTDHEYNACRNVINFVAERTGARVVAISIPFPIRSPEEAVESILDRVSPRTRILLIDHITSPSGLILPVDRIVREMEVRGIDCLVDGAHTAGMIPLDVTSLGAAYYTGNCHKWLCTPKGSAFLHVRRDRQQRIRPLIVSHGANSARRDRPRFRLEFDWTGTMDPTPYLTIPTAIRHLGSVFPGGWPDLMARNRALALESRRILCPALGVEPPCPDSMIGTLASFALPDGDPAGAPLPLLIDPLQDELRFRYRIEVPISYFPQPPQRWLRISAQLYNSRSQYVRLAGALRELLRS